MTKTVLDIAPQILDKVKASKHILLNCHVSPDPDSVGSVLAMKGALEGLGKQVTALRGDSEIPQAFDLMPGVDKITQKNFLEFDLSQVDLFISLDTGPTELISRKGPVVFPPNLAVAVIDHHVTNTRYGQINLVDSTYSSTCQMLADVFETWGVEVTHDMAMNLLTGMYTDTGGFKYSSVTPETFTTASKLVKIAPDYHKVIFGMENANTAGSIRFLGKALSSVENHCGGRLAIAAVPYDFIQSEKLTSEDIGTHGISDQIRSVIGWEVTAAMVEIEPGKVKTSFRTRNGDRYDVSKIASALAPSGGGHRQAAGVVIMAPLDKAKAMVVDAVTKYEKSI